MSACRARYEEERQAAIPETWVHNVVTSSTAYANARRGIRQACVAGLDARTLRLEVLAILRRAVAFDAYAWLLTDPATAVGSSPLADVPCLAELPALIRLKYGTAINRWTQLSRPVATLVDATAGDLALSALWQEPLRNYEIGDIASCVYRDRFGCWGFLDLWRTSAGRPFNEAETAFLTSIAEPLTLGLRRSQALTFARASSARAAPPGPVVLLLSPVLDVRAQTQQTQDYLRLLVRRDSDDDPIPAGAYNVAAQLLANEAGVDAQPPLARVHLTKGIWLTLQAARIGSASPKGADIAVSIEIASASDRLEVFSRAHGLSEREAELLQHLAGGADTREAARLMLVSELTVQDYLKAIFAKTNAHGRRTLLAHALGQ